MNKVYIIYAYNFKTDTIKCLKYSFGMVLSAKTPQEIDFCFSLNTAQQFELREWLTPSLHQTNSSRARRALAKIDAYFSSRRCKYQWGMVRVNSKNCPITTTPSRLRYVKFMRKTKDEILKCRVIKSTRKVRKVDINRRFNS